MDVTPPTKGVQALLADDGDRTDGHTHAGRRTQAACACTCDVRESHDTQSWVTVTRREGSGGRRDQTEERGGRHEGRERASDMTGQAGSRAGGDEPRGEERIGGHVASRRSSFSAAPDRSLRSCGGSPTTPTVDAVIGDVPAVRVVAVRPGRSRSPRRER